MTILENNRHVFSYCPHCRTDMIRRLDGGQERPVCPACGFVQYLNPAPAAAVVIMRGWKICLVQRKFEPRKNQWTLPAGFMEWDEDINLTAVREVLEETGLQVRLSELYSVQSGNLPPDIPVLVVFYRAVEVGGEMVAGDDAAAVGFFELDQLPGPIAFKSHREILKSIAKEIS